MSTKTRWRRTLAVAATVVAIPAMASAQNRTYELLFRPEASGATGTGTGRITVTGDLIRIQVFSFSGLSGTTTNAHIHCCLATPFTGTVGVATQVPTFTGFPAGVTAGSFDATYDMILNQRVGSPGTPFWNPTFVTASPGSTTQGAKERLIGGMDTGRSYLNIHTTAFPGGEIRAFIATPEPGTWALLATGLGMVGMVGWRRRRAA